MTADLQLRRVQRHLAACQQQFDDVALHDLAHSLRHRWKVSEPNTRFASLVDLKATQTISFVAGTLLGLSVCRIRRISAHLTEEKVL